MPTKKSSSNTGEILSCRPCICLNTGSALNRRQEVTPVSAEVGTSSSSTPSVSLRGDAESAEESSSSIGQPSMDTLGSVVPNQSGLVEARLSKRRDRSSSETNNASAVSLELLVHSKVTLSDTPTLSSYSHALQGGSTTC